MTHRQFRHYAADTLLSWEWATEQEGLGALLAIDFN